MYLFMLLKIYIAENSVGTQLCIIDVIEDKYLFNEQDTNTTILNII